MAAVGRWELTRSIRSDGTRTWFDATALGKGYRDSPQRGLLCRFEPPSSSDEMFRTVLMEDGWSARLPQHPGVQCVVDLVPDGETPYLVLEHVEGVSLRQLLREHGALSHAAAISLGAQLFGALSYLHALSSPPGVPLQLVHRALTLDHVWLTREGRVVCANPGTARLLHSPRTGLPQPEALDGLSPEQIVGVGIDARSDIYQGAYVVISALVGRSPLLCGDPFAVLRAIRSGEWTSWPEGLPPALDAILRLASSTDPARRPPSAIELERPLASLADEASAHGALALYAERFVTPLTARPCGMPV